IFEAPLAVYELAYRRTLGAVRAAVDRAVPARLLADPHAVGNFGRNRAADRTMRADALVDRHRGALRGRRAGLGPADACDRQRAQCREAAGSRTRAAKKSSAVETSAGFRGEAGKSAAALFAFGPSDQHRCLLQLG